MEHDVMREFLDLVEKHYRENTFTVEDAAAILGMHRTTLYRIVEKDLLCSPKQYLQHFRVQKALSLLRETSRSVKEIASDTGFGKTDRFCAAIRRTSGFTPKRYRALAAE